MIGKIKKGTSFKILVDYILNKKKEAKLLGGSGLTFISENRSLMIEDFITQAKSNPRVKRPVGHISLSFSKEDKEKLTSSFLMKVALEYLDKMEIKDTQFLIAEHFDKEHPHIHIAYNRINNKGKTISDRNDRYKNKRICKELTLKYGLYFSSGKENVKVERLKGADKTKYDIYYALKEFLPKCKNWEELKASLFRKGIQTEFKYKGETKEIQGIVFYKDGLKFTGSKVDREFSYSKIDYQLKLNSNKEQMVQPKPQTSSFSPSLGIGELVEDLFQPSYVPLNEDEAVKLERLRKRKKKGRKL